MLRKSWKLILGAGLFFACVAVMTCGGSTNGTPDGGTGGSGGSGGSGGGAAGPNDSGSTDAGLVGCLADAGVVRCPSTPVRYAQIQGILNRRCVEACHNGVTPDPANNNLPFWSLKDEEHASAWQDTIRQQTYACTMPPKEMGIPMTVDERRLLLEWVACLNPSDAGHDAQ